ncbi:MAG: hypothetical protein K2P81_00555 [Bacteriovoracaceae bacterium]|nr:hypothetical protein [Bacteriovoracaceae bacterium]
MGIPLNELLGIIISDKFYVEKKPKAAIAREMGLSRNTVKKYIKLKWPEMAAKIAKNAEISVLKQPEMTATPTGSHLGLKAVLAKIINEGDGELKHLNLLKVTEEIASYLGINCESDLLTLQTAIENYILYRSFMNRVNYLNGQILDVSWLENADKLSKVVSRYSVAVNNHLKIYQGFIKELEIKYNKRFPDIGRVQNLNIQRNDFSLSSSAAYETLPGQS